MPEAGGQRHPNPFAQEMARAVSMGHARGTLAWSAGLPDGRTIHWPCRMSRVLPGLQVLMSPRIHLYETDGGPDVADDAADELLALLLRTDARPAEWPHILVAQRLVAEGPVWEALQRLAGSGAITLHPIVEWERSILDRRAAPDAVSYVAQTHSASRVKRLRMKRKALEKLGSLTLDVATGPEDVQEAIDTFCALEAAGWKGAAGTALARDLDGLAYVAGLMAVLEAEGNAFALTLRLDGRAIASSLFVRSRGEVVFWKTAYDETLAKHSPGVVLDLFVTEWLYAQPWFETMDTGHDDSVDPSRELWSERRKMATVVIDMKPGSLKGRVVVAWLRARQRLRAWRNRRQAAK
jgi:Acetyltransferase (GNAT) domain